MFSVRRVAVGVALIAGLVWIMGVVALAGDNQPLSADKQTKLLQKHPEADANGDGVLTTEELRQYSQNKHRAGDAAGQAPQGGGLDGGKPGKKSGHSGRPDPAMLLKEHPELDTNHDGVLSDDELRAGRAKLTRPEHGPLRPGPGFFDWLIDHFGEADVDGNGQLSREEIMKLREQYAGPGALGPGLDGPGGQHLLQRFPEADTDHDGKLSPEEFRTFRESNPDTLRQFVLERRPEADTNRDGQLSDEELAAVKSKSYGPSKDKSAKRLGQGSKDKDKKKSRVQE